MLTYYMCVQAKEYPLFLVDISLSAFAARFNNSWKTHMSAIELSKNIVH